MFRIFFIMIVLALVACEEEDNTVTLTADGGELSGPMLDDDCGACEVSALHSVASHPEPYILILFHSHEEDCELFIQLYILIEDIKTGTVKGRIGVDVIDVEITKLTSLEDGGEIAGYFTHTYSEGTLEGSFDTTISKPSD